MGAGQEEAQRILEFVKREPRAVNEIAEHLGRSWVTAEKYVRQVAEETGLLSVKVFRKGTRGALKLVFYNHADRPVGDELQKELYRLIRQGRHKHHFDFLEVFQFVPDDRKRAFVESFDDPLVAEEQQLASFLRQAEREIFLFSGNLSILRVREGDARVVDLLEEALGRGVRIRILARISMHTRTNLEHLKPLLAKYPRLLEIRHTYQPLRGFIIDDRLARFKDQEHGVAHPDERMAEGTRIFYELWDPEWVAWLTRVFWNRYRTALDAASRQRELSLLAETLQG